MGTIKDRNGMDLTEAEDIKKRWQEYTGKLYRKDLHDPDNHDWVIKSSGPYINMIISGSLDETEEHFHLTMRCGNCYLVISRLLST